MPPLTFLRALPNPRRQPPPSPPAPSSPHGRSPRPTPSPSSARAGTCLRDLPSISRRRLARPRRRRLARPRRRPPCSIAIRSMVHKQTIRLFSPSKRPQGAHKPRKEHSKSPMYRQNIKISWGVTQKICEICRFHSVRKNTYQIYARTHGRVAMTLALARKIFLRRDEGCEGSRAVDRPTRVSQDPSLIFVSVAPARRGGSGTSQHR